MRKAESYMWMMGAGIRHGWLSGNLPGWMRIESESVRVGTGDIRVLCWLE